MNFGALEESDIVNHNNKKSYPLQFDCLCALVTMIGHNFGSLDLLFVFFVEKLIGDFRCKVDIIKR